MKRTLSFTLLVLLSLVQAQQVQLEGDVFDIAAELRCPVCRSESAADSSSQISTEFRDIIRERLQGGQSSAHVLTYFQRTYGDWILLDPPRRGLYLWVWSLPLVAGVVGLGVLGYFLTRWRRNAAAAPAASSEDGERARRERGRL